MHRVEPTGWSTRIHDVVNRKHLSQLELARALGVSAPTVSRWLNGKNEPTPQGYVALGNLAGPPDDVYFWERAGLDLKYQHKAPPLRAPSSTKLGVEDIPDFIAQRRSGPAGAQQSVIAIPLLSACAYADEMPPKEHVSLARAEVQDIIMAPESWVPHPDNLIAMHVSGESMFPTMQNDAVLVIDLADNDRSTLTHELVLASHRDRGFKVARLQRLSDCFVLVPANPSCMPIDVTNQSQWHIVGRVLWWVSRDTIAHPVK